MDERSENRYLDLMAETKTFAERRAPYRTNNNGHQLGRFAAGRRRVLM